MEEKFRKRLKKRRRRKKAAKNVGLKNDEQFSVHEVFLDDFADAPTKDNAFKKISKKMASSAGSFKLLRQVEKLEMVEEITKVSTSDDESPWYDRSDIGESNDEVNQSEEENEDIETLNIVSARNDTNDIQNDVLAYRENFYPLDLWCILANYIKPEQIQTFACICHGSYLAVSTVSFWSRLYERFVTDNGTLPARLKSDWIESRDGFKCRVIRALFITYKNLHNRLAQLTLETTRDTHVTSELVGLRCCHMWYELKTSKETNMYVFYFKFKRNDILKKRTSLYQDEEKFNYVHANSERDFVVLQIIVSNFIRVQSICGDNLTDISVHLSRNLRFHCIKMTFHAFRHDGRYRKCDGKMVLLDPVFEFHLLRWWYPFYPHCNE